MMMMRSGIVLQLLVSGVAAFAPSLPISIHRHPLPGGTEINQMFPAAGLEVVEEGVIANPFDSYTPSDEQKEIAFKDTKTGSGSAVGEKDGQLLQIKFTSKFVGGKFKANIKEFDVSSMVFKTGERRCLPGLEEGLKGMKIGGARSIKVPPGKGYGKDNWFRGVVPPNSHLQFDVELLAIAENPVQEFQMKLQQFGVERAIGGSVCFAYLVLSPILEKQGISVNNIHLPSF